MMKSTELILKGIVNKIYMLFKIQNLPNLDRFLNVMLYISIHALLRQNKLYHREYNGANDNNIVRTT